MSYPFKICDPIHGFIRFGDIEKQVINSRPFQRLLYIHQMAVAYLVYPGATHSRFEHSLGVMELATRIYNTLIANHNQLISLDKSSEELDYWRIILRLAALCHDMGHLPFSHTAEKNILMEGGHEGMTLKIIQSPELQSIWEKIGSQAAEDIAALSVPEMKPVLSAWKKVLSKIITEDSFGADRIDYLNRDGHYTGAAYGYFDYHQLIDSLRIFSDKNEFKLGIIASGIQSVESLWIARYMMYERVYKHPTVRIFSNHMRRFIIKYFQQNSIQNIQEYLDHTDYTLLSAVAFAAKNKDYDAQCLLRQAPPFCELILDLDLLEHVHGLVKMFGELIFIDEIPQKEITQEFPVYIKDNLISCFEAAPFLRAIPSGGKPLCLYVHPQKKEAVINYLKDHCVSDC